jgi:Zn-dependent alcohol dehydrogenase
LGTPTPTSPPVIVSRADVEEAFEKMHRGEVLRSVVVF